MYYCLIEKFTLWLNAILCSSLVLLALINFVLWFVMAVVVLSFLVCIMFLILQTVNVIFEYKKNKNIFYFYYLFLTKAYNFHS